MTEKRQLAVIVGVTLAVFLSMKYLLPYVIPFLIAWILVRAFHPVLKKIRSKLPWKKEVIMGVLVFLVFLSVGVGVYFFVGAVVKQVFQILSNFDVYQQQMECFLDDCCLSLEQQLGLKAERIRSFVNRTLANVQVQIDGKWMPELFNHSVQYVKGFIEMIGFVFLIYIAMLLLMKDYDEIREKLSGYQSFRHVKHVTDRMFQVGGAYLKSQVIIMGIIILLCIGGLYLLGNPYFLVLGILIGLLDALPFLGTGTVLIPWGIVLLLQREWKQALGYGLLFLVTNTVRELLEPRLVGGKIGVYPFVFALAVYAGVCLFGVGGIITGPASLLLIIEICREIWKEA